MAHFLKPPGTSEARWRPDLSRQEVVVGEFEHVALFGGDAQGQPLVVVSNDPNVLIVLEEPPLDGSHRVFRLTGAMPGNAMVEARNLFGQVWAFMQVQVVPWRALHRTGPRDGNDGQIPEGMRPRLQAGVMVAWELDGNALFRRDFAALVGTTMTVNQPLGPGRFVNCDAFALALNAMTVHRANTTRHPAVWAEIAAEAPASWIAGYTDPHARTNVYLRDRRLAETATLVGHTLVHEAMHVAGMPGDPLAEVAAAATEARYGIRRY